MFSSARGRYRKIKMTYRMNMEAVIMINTITNAVNAAINKTANFEAPL